MQNENFISGKKRGGSSGNEICWKCIFAGKILSFDNERNANEIVGKCGYIPGKNVFVLCFVFVSVCLCLFVFIFPVLIKHRSTTSHNWIYHHSY